MGVDGQRHAPASTSGERPDTHCIGGWVGPRVGLDGRGKSRPLPGFDPQTVHLVAIVIPTELERPSQITYNYVKLKPTGLRD